MKWILSAFRRRSALVPALLVAPLVAAVPSTLAQDGDATGTPPNQDSSLSECLQACFEEYTDDLDDCDDACMECVHWLYFICVAKALDQGCYDNCIEEAQEDWEACKAACEG